MSAPANEVDRLQNRIAELEELCGLQETLAANPFSGQHRARLLTIAKLFAARELVSKTTVALAIGGENFSEHTPAVYVSHLRKQLAPDITVRTEWSKGWYLSAIDRDRLRALLAGAA